MRVTCSTWNNIFIYKFFWNIFFPEYGHATSVVIQDAKKQEKFDQSKPQAMDWIKSQARKTFSKKNLYKKVPVLEWLPKYNVDTGLFTSFVLFLLLL